MINQLTNMGIMASANDQTTYTYPYDAYTTNLAYAYSLRKLVSSYSGKAIKVKRSSDGTTLDIGFVNNSLDLVALGAFVSSGTGYVTTWYDQSGNGRNLDTVTNDTSSPTIVNSGVIEVDGAGLPRIKFAAASTQRIYTTTNYNITTVAPSSTGANTTVLVLKPVYNATYVNPTPLSFGNSSINPRLVLHLPYGTDFYYDHGNSSTLRINATKPANADYFDQAVVVMGCRAKSTATSEHTIRVNGTSIASSTFSGSFTAATKRFSIGAHYTGNNTSNNYSDPFDGYMQELVIWSADIGATALSDIETECLNYY